MSPVPWRIVRFDAYMADLDGMKQWCSIGAEAPPEVVPAVWTHEGCPCGGRGEVESMDAHDGTRGHYVRQPCPDGRLVPWKGEEE